MQKYNTGRHVFSGNITRASLIALFPSGILRNSNLIIMTWLYRKNILSLCKLRWRVKSPGWRQLTKLLKSNERARAGDVHIFNISKVAAGSYTGMEREVNCYFVTRRVRNPLWDDGVLRICMKKERAFQQLVYKLLPNECKFFFESSLDESLGICLRKYDVIVRRNIASSPPLPEAARNALSI